MTGPATYSAGVPRLDFALDAMRTAGSPWFDPTHPRFGAKGDGVTNDTRAMQACIDAAAGAPIRLPPLCTFLVDQLRNAPGRPLVLDGGHSTTWGSLFQATNAANVTIQLGATADVAYSKLRGLIINGSLGALGGLDLGSAVGVCSFTTLDEIRILNYSKAGAYGIGLNTVQELSGHNVVCTTNDIGLYRPNLGYCTSTVFSGARSYLGAGRVGMLCDGPILDIAFLGVNFESNQQEHIRAVGVVTNIALAYCYSEAGAIASSDEFVISGVPAGAASTFSVVEHEFQNAGRGAARHLNLDNVIGVVVSRCPTLFASNTIGHDVVTTANTQAHFRDCAGGADTMPLYNALLGNISFEESPTNTTWRVTGPRGVSLKALALSLVEEAHVGSNVSFGWKTYHDEVTTGDRMLYRVVGGVETLVARYVRATGNVIWAAAVQGTEFDVGGTKVIGARGAAVATVAGTAGAAYTATEQGIINNLVTAVNALLSRLSSAAGHGLIT